MITSCITACAIRGTQDTTAHQVRSNHFMCTGFIWNDVIKLEKYKTL